MRTRPTKKTRLSWKALLTKRNTSVRAARERIVRGLDCAISAPMRAVEPSPKRFEKKWEPVFRNAL